MIKASVLGATGYAGQEIVRILSMHPQVEIAGLGSQSYAGQSYSYVYPHFRNILDKTCKSPQDPEVIADADVVFLALPHGLSSSLAEEILQQGKKVIDLGADFRLNSQKTYQAWYKAEPPSQELLQKAVYGISELNRDRIKVSSLIANPGCYPTSIILGLAPLLREKIIDTQFIIIDSKSGVSGAGRKVALGSHYSEVNEDLKVYGLPRHRHTPEIEQELSLLGEEDIKVSFTPHLIPMTRGMLSTIYTKPKAAIKINEVIKLYQDFYHHEPFIRVLPEGEYPHTKYVLSTNCCDIGLNWDERTGRLIIITVIDNLVKGAAGQAVQNMNMMFGLEEDIGLNKIAVYP